MATRTGAWASSTLPHKGLTGLFLRSNLKKRSAALEEIIASQEVGETTLSPVYM